MTYAYNPDGLWTGQHQMSINGKRKNIAKADMLECAKHAGIKNVKALEILEQVRDACDKWPNFAEGANLSEFQTKRIGEQFACCAS
jgi:serine/threonine-protein kinase HipA